MLFILRFTDKPHSLHIRERHLSEHVAWLDAHAEQVLVAGTLRTDPQAAPVAAQWIVKADSPEAALALSETDPFWVQGLRATRELFHYRVHTALAALQDA